MSHDDIVALFEPVPDGSRPDSALDILADRMARIADDIHRSSGAVSWRLAGAEHTACATSNRLAASTVLAEDCSLGMRECEQTLGAANRYLTLTRWLVDLDQRAIVARSEIELTASTWPWATRAFAIACAVHAGFGAGVGGRILAHCKPGKVHVDEPSGDRLLRSIQRQLPEIDLPYSELDAAADALREEGSGLPVRTGERLHVPLGADTYGATLELRLDEDHPALGVGLLVLSSVPGSGDPTVDHRLAAALNRADDAGLGPWVVADNGLEHATFLPARLLDDATQRPAVLAALALAELRRVRRLTGGLRG